jgi:hypothetical protein
MLRILPAGPVLVYAADSLGRCASEEIFSSDEMALLLDHLDQLEREGFMVIAIRPQRCSCGCGGEHPVLEMIRCH